jgi:Tol biopolymer transport system component/DNA-binding winged helix-turn-helix (wHTH) protein
MQSTPPKSDPPSTNGRTRLSSGAETSGPGEFSLAGWTILPLQNRLLGHGREVTLEPKAMDVLVQLTLAGGATLSCDELMDAVWPGVIVADDSVHRAISKLRRALAECPPLKEAVVTVPRRGYRLDLARLQDGPDEGAANGEPDTRAHARNRVAGAAGLVAVALVVLLVLAAMVFRPASIDRSTLRSTPFTGLPGQERAASFAPDGRRAVFVWSGDDGSTWDLYVKAIDKWAPARLTDQPGKEFNPAWSPDGATIAFVHLLPGGGCRIMTMDLASRQQHMLRSCTAGGDVDLSWSPESDVLFFTDRVGISGPVAVHSFDLARATEKTESAASQLWSLPMAGGDIESAKPLARASGWHWHPSMSPDGGSIAFVSDRSGSPEVWVAQADGASPRILTRFGGPYTISPSWSPDGRQVLFATPVAGNFEIYTVEVETGILEQRTEHPATDRNPAWSRDGRSVYFASNRTGGWEVWRLSLDDGTLEQVTRSGGFRAREREDGALLYVKRDEPGLFLTEGKPGAMEEDSRLTRRLLPLDWSNWEVGGLGSLSGRDG